MTTPPHDLPVVHVMLGRRHGAVTSIVFNFGKADALREEIMGRLKRIMEGPPGLFGEVTVRMLGTRGEAVAELQRPCSDLRIIDPLVRALAAKKFQLVFDGILDEDALEQELLRLIGLLPREEPPSSPN